MMESEPKCLVCQATSDKAPLLAFLYQEKQYHVCPQHLPVLIHKPQTLVGVLPGAENLSAHEH